MVRGYLRRVSEPQDLSKSSKKALNYLFDGCEGKGFPQIFILVLKHFKKYIKSISYRSLMGLTNGKVLALLEGGYFIPSLQESAALTLQTLLGDPVPVLLENLGKKCQIILLL